MATRSSEFSEIQDETNRFAEWTSEEMSQVVTSSPIADLNNYLLPLHTSYQQLVQLAVQTAIDNLRLAAFAADRLDKTPPFATPTLIRAAATAASTAVWLLADDQCTRKIRALLLLAQDYTDYARFMSASQTASWFNDEGHTTAANHKAEADRRKGEARAMIAQLRTAHSDLNDTRFSDLGAVVEASNRIPAIVQDTELPADLLAWHWQKLSGVAHGRQWSTLIQVQPPDQQPQEPTLRKHTIAADTADLFEAASVTLCAVRAARLQYIALNRVPLAH